LQKHEEEGRVQGSWVKFINVLQAAFIPADPKSVTIQLSCQYLSTLFESASIKAADRTLMKSTPGEKNNLKLRVSVLKKEKFSKIEKVQIKAKLFLMSR